MTLLGPEGRRRVELKYMPNDQVFTLYAADLIIRIRNEKNLKTILQFLNRFKTFLGSYPPSSELAKGFLAQYTGAKPHTWYNYVGEIKRFMGWYGEPLKLKAKLPKTLPDYHEDGEVEALLAVAKSKRTHKKAIPRDLLLVELAWRTGMRRAELSKLSAGDIHPNFLVIREGKGGKDRLMPLTLDLAEKLHNFTKGMEPNERIFKLNPTSLGMKIKDLAKRAGLTNFHCHSLRHKFACDVLEGGANIEVLRQLMGHANIGTTQVYLSATDKSLREAIKSLSQKSNKFDIPEGWEQINPTPGTAIVMHKKAS